MTLTTAIESGIVAPSSRLRLGPVASEVRPSQLHPPNHRTRPVNHDAGARKARSASGEPPSAPTMLIQAATGAPSSGESTRVRANATSAPDLLALTRITRLPSRPAIRTVSAMTAALASTDAL